MESHVGQIRRPPTKFSSNIYPKIAICCVPGQERMGIKRMATRTKTPFSFYSVMCFSRLSVCVGVSFRQSSFFSEMKIASGFFYNKTCGLIMPET